MSKKIIYAYITGILVFLSASCGSGGVRLGSHEVVYQKRDDGSLYIGIDGKGEKTMRLIDFEDDGIVDVTQIVHVMGKSFVTIMGKDGSDVVMVTLGEGGSVHDGRCNVVTKGSLYQCKWGRERWEFMGSDGIEYYVKMSDQKNGYAILPIPMRLDK